MMKLIKHCPAMLLVPVLLLSGCVTVPQSIRGHSRCLSRIWSR